MTIPGHPEKSSSESYLFTLRLWREEKGFSNSGWRGRIQYVKNKEVRYFSDWGALEQIVEAMLDNITSTEAALGNGG